MSGTADVRTLDVATFTVPPGWHVETRGSGDGQHVVMSKAAAGSYCMAVVYASVAASNGLDASFASEWARVALQTLDPVATPRPAITQVGPLRVAAGAAASTAQGQPIIGLLLVVDAGARVVSILILSPSFGSLEPYRAEVDTVLGTLTIRGQSSPPLRLLSIADLAGAWGRNDGINTRMVDRSTGAYAGTDSIHFTEKWEIGAAGTIALDFYGIHNGRRIAEKSSGTVTLSSDGVLAIRMTNEQRYVLRGWEDAPDMTVMTLNGPWYDSIPPEILSNPAQGANLDQRWVRVRRTSSDARWPPPGCESCRRWCWSPPRSARRPGADHAFRAVADSARPVSRRCVRMSRRANDRRWSTSGPTSAGVARRS